MQCARRAIEADRTQYRSTTRQDATMEKVEPLHTITPRIESPLADADHEKDAVDHLFELFFIIVVTAVEVFFAYR